jgi:hypothetical protein
MVTAGSSNVLKPGQTQLTDRSDAGAQQAIASAVVRPDVSPDASGASGFDLARKRARFG